MNVVSRRSNYRRKTYRKPSRAVKQYVQRAIGANVENKQVTVSMNATFSAITTTWTEADLCNITQGVTGPARIGRKVKLCSLEINCVIAEGAAEILTDDPYNVVRCMVALWSGAAGTTPLATAGTTINAPIRKNLGTRNYLIKKYLDKYIGLQVTSTEKGGGDGYTPQLKNIKYYKKFKKPILITWGDDTTTYPDKRLMISMISDSSAVTNPGIIAGYAVMTYEDA